MSSVINSLINFNFPRKHKTYRENKRFHPIPRRQDQVGLSESFIQFISYAGRCGGERTVILHCHLVRV